MAYNKYIVKQGDCISSIAYKYGFFPDTIWNDSKNSKLKQDRKNPNVLLPGDEVYIRDKKEKEESCESEQRHRFRRKGVPEYLSLRLLKDYEPQANVEYALDIEGRLFTGTSDDKGSLKHPIPPNAMKGKLLVDGKDEYEVELGNIDPIDTDTGLAARLRNLGFLEDEEKEDEEAGNELEEEASELGLVAKDDEDDMAADLRDAIRAFQDYYGLPVTGEADDTTRKKLVEIHQS